MNLRVACYLFGVLAIASVNSKKANELDLTDVLDPDRTADPELARKEMNEGEEGVVGDIYVGKDSVNRNAKSDPKRKWPRATVPYVWDSSVDSPENRQAFQKVVDEYQKYTCVKIVPRTNEDDYVRIRGKMSFCSSAVGRQGGEQMLTLSNGCYMIGTLLHELMHVLGFAHEQSRSDRDEYITVHYDKLPEHAWPQYKKLDPKDEDNMGFPYDYSSLLHYPAFDVITTKDPKWQKMLGQRSGFSKQDVQEINRYYECSGPGGTSGVEGVVIPKPQCEDSNTPYCEGLNIVNGNDKWNNCEKDIVTISLCQKSCKKC